MKTMPVHAKSGPNIGVRRSSCLPIGTTSRLRSLHSSSVSMPLWWLKMKTAGRCDHRCSSPSTASSMPASAVPSSPQVVMPDVHGVAPRAVQQRGGQAREEARNEAPTPSSAVRTTSATPGPAAAAEAPRRPAARLGDLRERAIGVQGPRIADDLEERKVLVAVGVEVALRELAASLLASSPA